MWTIHVEKNTVKINKEIAKELYAATTVTYDDKNGKGSYNEVWDLGEPVDLDGDDLEYIMNDDGTLYFNSDDFEHMDYMNREEIQEVLKKNKVEGDICFLDNEGYEDTYLWGYRFDGKGGMVKLTGQMSSIVWEEDKQVETQ